MNHYPIRTKTMYYQTQQNQRSRYRSDTTHRETITIPFHRMKLVEYWETLAKRNQLNKSQYIRKLIGEDALKEGLIKSQIPSEVM